MIRKIVLECLKVAGYHQDNAEFTRLLIENRVSYQAAKKAYRQGYKLKELGMKCTFSKWNQF